VGEGGGEGRGSPSISCWYLVASCASWSRVTNLASTAARLSRSSAIWMSTSCIWKSAVAFSSASRACSSAAAAAALPACRGYGVYNLRSRDIYSIGFRQEGLHDHSRACRPVLPREVGANPLGFDPSTSLLASLFACRGFCKRYGETLGYRLLRMRPIFSQLQLASDASGAGEVSS